ncbi:response regulator transcription factor [Lewinella sp. 4G2]|uniref:response regulator transcription factor n=1 Tax=Lewinella sp. 4G2 TaxID=1803372 RepID=UPI0007B48FAA|nr:response regulator transcription factor [Lewinella sp. 4G2]OAV43997.1 DNA-binding response regulator [Lewinella sp. 4G2]
MERTVKSILIVEDEAIIALEIELALRQLGYRVVGKAANGDKALDLLASTNPDLVLLDIDIKGTLNGVDLARIIRSNYHFPFVFLTALSDRATLNSLRDTLPYGYIVKPFNESDLYTTIEIALDKFKAEHQPSFPSREALNSQLPEPLSEREYEVLRHIDEGYAYREIADRLFVSVNTIKHHQKSLFAKMQLHSRHQVSHYLRNLDSSI